MMFSKKLKYFSLLITLCFIQSEVVAQSTEGMLFNVSLTTGYDDNLLRTATKKTDSFFAITPLVGVNALYGKHSFSIEYEGDYTLYTKNSEFNNTQHDINLRVLFDHNNVFNTEFNVFYQDRIEEPGINYSVLSENAEGFKQYSRKGIEADFRYGTVQSTGQLLLSIASSSLEFDDAFQAFRNYDTNSITGTFFYTMGSKTRLLFETSYATFDFTSTLPTSDQSNDANKYFLGVEWNATVKTDGSFRLGYQRKQYDAEQFKTISGLSYIAELNWQATSYTTLSAGASKRPRESGRIDEGGFFSSNYSLNIAHKLLHNLQIVGSLKITSDEIVSSVKRTDKRQEIEFGINYRMNSWLESGLHYRHQKRKSEVGVFNFDANIVEISFNSKFD